MSRRLPPFGRHLAAKLANGWTPDNGTFFVACGSDAWELARGWHCPPRAFAVLPPGANPETFNWSAAGELDAVILALGEIADEQIENLALEMLRHGTRLVYAGRLDLPDTGWSWVRQRVAA